MVNIDKEGFKDLIRELSKPLMFYSKLSINGAGEEVLRTFVISHTERDYELLTEFFSDIKEISVRKSEDEECNKKEQEDVGIIRRDSSLLSSAVGIFHNDIDVLCLAYDIETYNGYDTLLEPHPYKIDWNDLIIDCTKEEYKEVYEKLLNRPTFDFDIPKQFKEKNNVNNYNKNIPFRPIKKHKRRHI